MQAREIWKPFIGMSIAMAVLMMSLMLGGCSTVPDPPQPVNITAHDYCEIAAKIDWDIKDTPETIQSVRRENAKWDRRCLRRPLS